MTRIAVTEVTSVTSVTWLHGLHEAASAALCPCKLCNSCNSCNFPSRRQFKKWHYALLQVARRQLKHFGQRDGVGHIELAGVHPPQRRQVRPAAELLPQLVRDAADVGPLRAGEAEMAKRLLVGTELEVIHMHQARLPRHLDALARQLVKRHAVYLHR